MSMLDSLFDREEREAAVDRVAPPMDWSDTSVRPSATEVAALRRALDANTPWALAMVTHVRMACWPAVLSGVPDDQRPGVEQFLREQVYRHRAAQVIKRFSPPVTRGADAGPITPGVREKLKQLRL